MIDKSTWKSGRIKDICERGSSNLSLKVIEDNEGEYPIYGASGLIKYVDFYHQESEYIGLVKDGAGVGRVQYLPAYSSIIGTLQYIIPKANYPVKFIGYYLQSLKLERFATGATIPHIYFRDYGECKIKIPPLPTQHQIVSELDTLNSIIDKKKEQLNELDNLAQATFYDMFGDPVENEKGWGKRNGSDLFEIFSGGVFKSGDYVETGIPLIRIGAVNKGYFDESDLAFLSEEFLQSHSRYLLYPGDLLMTLTGTVGKNDYGNTFILDDRFNQYFLNQRVAKLEVFPKVLNKVFLSYILQQSEVKGKLTGLSRGVRQANISNRDLYSLNLILPPLPLQTQFAEKIKHIEQQKALIQRSINNVQQLFDYTMDKYFN